MKIKTKIALVFILIIALFQLKAFCTEELLVEKIEITNENLYEIYEEAIENKITENKKNSQNSNEVPTFLSNQIPLKEYIKQECKKFNEEVNISEYKVTYAEVSNLMTTLFLEADMFYIRGFNISYDAVTELVYGLYPAYTMTEQEAIEYWNGIDKTTQEYLSKIDENMSDLDKILFTNNYLCQICDYVEYETEEELNNIDWTYHTMAKALTEGYAVCDGYSKAFSYLLNQVGIEASLVTSDLLCHAWNLVKFENNYYHIDTTWNDVGMYGKTNYNFFMLSDTEMFNRDHNVNNTKDWVQEYTATNTQFDTNNNAWINGLDNYLIYKEGYWYAVGLIQNDYNHFYLYKYDIDLNTYITYTVTVESGQGHYPGLTSDGNKLYFSNYNQIMEMDFNGENVEVFYTIDISSAEYIFSVEYRKGRYYYTTTGDLEKVYEYLPISNIPEYTTLPVTVLASKDTFILKKDTVIKDILIEANFPILSIDYDVIVLNSSKVEKAKTEKLGSKNVVQIKNGTEVLKEYTVIVPGDTDGDGRARIFDAYEILRDSIITSSYDEIDTKIRDYNSDGKVRIFDAYEYLKESIL